MTKGRKWKKRDEKITAQISMKKTQNIVEILSAAEFSKNPSMSVEMVFNSLKQKGFVERYPDNTFSVTDSGFSEVERLTVEFGLGRKWNNNIQHMLDYLGG